MCISLGFDNIDTRDMAYTLAYLDFKLFRRISVSCVYPSVCVYMLCVIEKEGEFLCIIFLKCFIGMYVLANCIESYFYN